MNEPMRAILASKRRERSRLASLPFSEKIPLLERLRDRAMSIKHRALYQVHGSRAGKALVVREPAPAVQPKKRDAGT